MKHRCTLPVQYAQRKEATPRFFCSLQNNPLYFDSFPRKRKKSPTRPLRWKCRCTRTSRPRWQKNAGGESPEPLRVLSLACFANSLLAQATVPGCRASCSGARGGSARLRQPTIPSRLRGRNYALPGLLLQLTAIRCTFF